MLSHISKFFQHDIFEDVEQIRIDLTRSSRGPFTHVAPLESNPNIFDALEYGTMFIIMRSE
jgi:hypothetical protein